MLIMIFQRISILIVDGLVMELGFVSSLWFQKRWLNLCLWQRLFIYAADLKKDLVKDLFKCNSEKDLIR